METESVSETLGNFNALTWLFERQHLIEHNVSSTHQSGTVWAPTPLAQWLPGVNGRESDANISLLSNIMANK
jgi:hypothetical protein